MSLVPTLLSYRELQVVLPVDVQNYVRLSYESHHRATTNQQSSEFEDNDAAALLAERHMQRLLWAMKTPPSCSIVRVNHLSPVSKEEVVSALKQTVRDWFDQRGVSFGDSSGEDVTVAVDSHELFDDVITIHIQENPKRSHTPRLSDCNAPSKDSDAVHFSASLTNPAVSDDVLRIKAGWPVTHRVVICDRFCGEAVLRGSDIFVRGILCADAGIRQGEVVAVYADLSTSNQVKVTRGSVVEKYTGRCIFLGLGTAACNRSDFFRLQRGTAIQMAPLERVGPILPPLPSVPGLLQNLPSIVVGHVLSPQRNDMILDMCTAPGGKALHLASLVHNQAIIVACDRSKRKMLTAQALFAVEGATCITPIAADSTRLLRREATTGAYRTVPEVLASAERNSTDGLLNISCFYEDSFDRIMLDPPCSALGLRPKLHVEVSLSQLKAFATYQKRLIRTAVALLKPGGVLTYSTCTINTMENEGMVRHVLDTYPELRLEGIDFPIGSPGLAAAGLDDQERHRVRRFDPTGDDDTIGFFLAKFRKVAIETAA